MYVNGASACANDASVVLMGPPGWLVGPGSRTVTKVWNQTMSQKPTTEGDIIATIRKRLQEMEPSAMKSLEDVASPKKNKTVAKKTKRVLHKHKGRK